MSLSVCSASAQFHHVKRIQLCATLTVRGVFASTHQYCDKVKSWFIALILTYLVVIVIHFHVRKEVLDELLIFLELLLALFFASYRVIKV